MRQPLFDSLTADEIRRVARVIRDEGVGLARPGFSAVFTDEPDKYQLRAGQAPPRRARAMTLDRDRYPNQSRSGAGLTRWTQANRSVEDTDVVSGTRSRTSPERRTGRSCLPPSEAKHCP